MSNFYEQNLENDLKFLLEYQKLMDSKFNHLLQHQNSIHSRVDTLCKLLETITKLHEINNEAVSDFRFLFLRYLDRSNIDLREKSLNEQETKK